MSDLIALAIKGASLRAIAPIAIRVREECGHRTAIGEMARRDARHIAKNR